MPLTVQSNIPDLNKASVRLRKQLPVIVANKSKNHYLEGFRRGGGMTNKSRGGWKPRKRADRQTSRRAILVKAGILRNDLDIRKTTFEEIILGTQDTIYASVHNEGERSGRGGGFDMPQREFLGASRLLDQKVNRLILKKMKQIYK